MSLKEHLQIIVKLITKNLDPRIPNFNYELDCFDENTTTTTNKQKSFSLNHLKQSRSKRNQRSGVGSGEQLTEAKYIDKIWTSRWGFKLKNKNRSQVKVVIWFECQT